jgi:cytochrome d ubiquinol oxidase subunit II
VTLAEVPLVLMLVGLTAYAVLGGADFGAAFWHLGGRSEAQREHAYAAMGPVWEANHVWLIFVLAICWTAYPEAFASIFSTLTVPLFLAALGIILRGTAYAVHAGTAREIERQAIDAVFSVSSILTPFALGTTIGGIASGRVPVGNAEGDLVTSWVNPTSVAIGVIAVATGVYLAAVYLAGDAARAGLDDLAAAFRARALAAGAVTGAVALGGLLVVSLDSEMLRRGLFGWPAILALIASAAAGVATLELVRRARFEPARYLASAAVAAIVVGWALAQRPELLPRPDGRASGRRAVHTDRDDRRRRRRSHRSRPLAHPPLRPRPARPLRPRSRSGGRRETWGCPRSAPPADRWARDPSPCRRASFDTRTRRRTGSGSRRRRFACLPRAGVGRARLAVRSG